MANQPKPSLTVVQSVLPFVKVTLGQREYIIKPLPSGKARAWRSTLMEPLEGVLGLLGNLSGIKFETPADLMGLLPILKDALLGSIDLVVDSVISYDNKIKEDWDSGYLQEEAYDEQFIDALAQVIKLAYPLGKMMALLPKGAGSGLSALTMQQKSQSVNGESPTTTKDTKAQ